MFWANITIGVCLISALSMNAMGAEDSSLLNGRLKQELHAQFPGARIELSTPVRWISGSVPPKVGAVRITSDNQRGEANFYVLSGEDQGVAGEGVVGFSAWLPALVANKRIQPNESLASAEISRREVNVSSGMGREFKGVILPVNSDLSRLESRQTILDGQFIVSTAVRRVPDLRKGEMVRIKMQSGDVVLYTAGTAEEAGYLDSQVRVMTTKTKKLLMGKLKQGSVVEVTL